MNMIMMMKISKSKVPFLITTFDDRYFLVDNLLQDISNLFDESLVFLASEKEEYTNNHKNIKFTHLKYPEKDRTNNRKNECQSWGYRLFESLKYLKNKGHKYVVWLCDDTRISEVNHTFDLIDVMGKHQIDRFHLSNITTRIYKLENFEGELKKIHPSSQYYSSHQISCWDIDSLLTVTKPSDTAGKHEGQAGERAREKNMLFICNQPPIYHACNNYTEYSGGWGLQNEEEIFAWIERLKNHENFKNPNGKFTYNGAIFNKDGYKIGEH